MATPAEMREVAAEMEEAADTAPRTGSVSWFHPEFRGTRRDLRQWAKDLRAGADAIDRYHGQGGERARGGAARGLRPR